MALMDNNSWPELVPALFEMVQTGNERLMSSALAVFAELALYVVDCLIPVFDTIQQMLGATMGHPSLEVQLQSLRLVSGFIQVGARALARRCCRAWLQWPAGRELQAAVLPATSLPSPAPSLSLAPSGPQSIEEPSQRDKLQGLVGSMLACLGRTLTSGDEASAQEALTMFIEVAEAHPRFLRKQLGEVVQAMLQVRACASPRRAALPACRRTAAATCGSARQVVGPPSSTRAPPARRTHLPTLLLTHPPSTHPPPPAPRRAAGGRGGAAGERHAPPGHGVPGDDVRGARQGARHDAQAASAG